MLIITVGKKGALNGEVSGSSPEASSSPSQNRPVNEKRTAAKDDTDAAATEHNKQNSKPFDINDFFLSDTLLPFTGGVSSCKLKIY